MTPLFLILIATGAHAALIWDSIDSALPKGGATQVTYEIPYNGGEFFNWDTPFYLDSFRGNIAAINNISSQLVGMNQKNYTSDAKASLTSIAGGSTLENGFSNTLGSTLNYSDFDETDAMMIRQQPISSSFRNFTTTADGTATIEAEISGATDFFMENFDVTTGQAINPMAPYFGFTIASTTEVISFSKTQGQVSATFQSIKLDNVTQAGTISMELSSDPDIYYVLRTSLTLNTYISNEILGSDGTVIPLADQTFNIGEWINSECTTPLALSSSVTMATPIPGSLLLLISGMGGMVTFNRRLRKTTGS